MRYSKFSINFRMQKNWKRISHNNCGQYGFVHISWDENLVPRTNCSKYHGHDGGACTLYREIRRIRPKCSCSQVLGMFNWPRWVMKVVERCDIDEIESERVVADKLLEFCLHSSSPLMARDMKLHRLSFYVSQQRV